MSAENRNRSGCRCGFLSFRTGLRLTGGYCALRLLRCDLLRRGGQDQVGMEFELEREAQVLVRIPLLLAMAWKAETIMPSITSLRLDHRIAHQRLITQPSASSG